MNEARKNTPLDRFVSKVILLLKVFVFYLWQPIRRPVWFYETRIEANHKDTQKFLIETAGFFGLILALSVRFSAESDLNQIFFFGYSISDVFIVGDFYLLVLAFFVLLLVASGLSSLEITGLMFTWPSNIKMSDYFYYRVVTIISSMILILCLFMFIGFARLISINLLGLSEAEQRGQIPTLLAVLFGVSFVLLFAPTYIVLRRKMSSWWRPLFLFVGWIVYVGFLFNRVPS